MRILGRNSRKNCTSARAGAQTCWPPSVFSATRPTPLGTRGARPAAFDAGGPASPLRRGAEQLRVPSGLVVVQQISTLSRAPFAVCAAWFLIPRQPSAFWLFGRGAALPLVRCHCRKGKSLTSDPETWANSTHSFGKLAQQRSSVEEPDQNITGNVKA